MRTRAVGSRRVTGFLALGGLTALAGACSSDFDTSRVLPARGTLGEELYGVVCDRVGAQALHEDLTGESFRPICHKDSTGQFGNTVDQTKLPGIDPNAVDKDGNPVPVAKQTQDRQIAVARIEALGKRRSDLIAALDATFPDIKVAVVDNKNPDPTKSCKPPAASGEARLHDELADLLGRFQNLYNDGTIPQSTEGLARVMNAFKASPDAQGALARFDARQGYRPVETILGALRPLIAYPKLRDLANASLSLMSSDSKPYDPNPPRDKNGNRIPVAGSAYPQFSKLLEVTHNELRDTTADPPVAPLAVSAPDPATRVVLSRPRTNLEFLQEIFYAQDPAFGGGTPRYIARRDPRGYVALAGAGGVPAPFVDKDGDGLPDIDALGRFVTTDSSVAPTPFFAVGSAFGNRDTLGRPTDAKGALLYGYIDTTHTFTAQLMSDTKPLVVADATQKHETLMYALAGANVLFGARDGAPKTQRQYSPDATLVDDWKLTHSDGTPPPADLATRKVVVSYDAFHTDTSALLDLVYAVGQMMGDASFDDTLQLVRTLLASHTGDLARVAGDALFAKAIADKHAEAKIPAKSTLWDEMIDVTVQVAKEPGLLEDVLRALADDNSAQLGTIFSSYMAYNDHITVDRTDVNAPAFNATTNASGAPMKTPVDRTKPMTGANRSAFMKFVQTIHDTNGVTACNKEGAVVHARGIPLLGNADICSGALGLCSALGTRPFHECEVFQIQNLGAFYLDSMIGKANLYFRPSILRNGILGIGASNVGIIENSSGIGYDAANADRFNGGTDATLPGFWDLQGAQSFHPKPGWLNRLVNFDIAGDTQQPTQSFLKDLQGVNIGTAVCPERIITDPDPGAADANPDGKVHGLRACADGDWLFQRDQDATMVWEDFGFYRAITPLVTAFANHNREDLFLALMEVQHRHWADAAATANECKLGGGQNCTRDGAVSYEPLLVEMFATDILTALHQAAKTVNGLTIPHCQATDPKTHLCTQTTNVSGITVLAQATRALVSPDLAKTQGLVDRRGAVTSLRNDGTTNPQVTPLYLMLEALNNFDAAFAAYAAANTSDTGRQDQWKLARSQLVDQFLDVNGKNTPTQTFANAGFPKISVVLIDALRAQLLANCPDSFSAPFTRCAWAKDQLTSKLATTMGGPLFASAMDLLDAIRKDDPARAQIETLLAYLLDAASTNDALAALLASASDMVQAFRDDTNLVPLFKAISVALKSSLVDNTTTPPTIVQKSVVDGSFALLARISGKAFDANKVEVCSSELDPNQILSVALAHLVTPMTGANGKPTQTPLEVIMDVVADVNRAAPGTAGKLQGGDYANIADNVSDFLLNKERGLEQFYQIVRQGTVH